MIRHSARPPYSKIRSIICPACFSAFNVARLQSQNKFAGSPSGPVAVAEPDASMLHQHSPNGAECKAPQSLNKQKRSPARGSSFNRGFLTSDFWLLASDLRLRLLLLVP